MALLHPESAHNAAIVNQERALGEPSAERHDCHYDKTSSL
ncbi:MAG: hypothetical protein RL417_1788 [Pseudomonadota bacterium]|jgi:hypothetical protein